MATIIKCDRCCNEIVGKDKPNQLKFIGILGDITYDICDQCTYKFTDFMNKIWSDDCIINKEAE